MEEAVIHGMIGKLTEIGKCYGMHMNVKNTKVMRISRQPSPIQIHQKTAGECGILQLF
jgi:hypothetical protein